MWLYGLEMKTRDELNFIYIQFVFWHHGVAPYGTKLVDRSQ
jgi:hypothetical protein